MDKIRLDIVEIQFFTFSFWSGRGSGAAAGAGRGGIGAGAAAGGAGAAAGAGTTAGGAGAAAGGAWTMGRGMASSHFHSKHWGDEYVFITGQLKKNDKIFILAIGNNLTQVGAIFDQIIIKSLLARYSHF